MHGKGCPSHITSSHHPKANLHFSRCYSLSLSVSRFFVFDTTTYTMQNKTNALSNDSHSLLLTCHKQMTLHPCPWGRWLRPNGFECSTAQKHSWLIYSKRKMLKNRMLVSCLPSSSPRSKTPQAMLANKTFRIFVIAAVTLLATVNAAPASEAAGNFWCLEHRYNNANIKKLHF